MNIQLEIEHLKKELDTVHDESLIKIIKNLLAFARTRSYERKLKPMSIKEYRARADRSEADIRNGKVYTVDRVEKESENW